MLALLPFAFTYLCEKSFSTLTYLKTKYRSNLKDLEHVLRPAITEIEPRFDLLCDNMQAHQSHLRYCEFYYFFNIFCIIKFYIIVILVPGRREKIWPCKVGRDEKSLKNTELEHFLDLNNQIVH